MKHLFRIHFHQFFQNRLFIISILSIGLLNIVYYYLAKDANSTILYFQTSFTISKINCIVLAIYFFGFYMNLYHDSYAYLILPHTIGRGKYLFSKLLVFSCFFFGYLMVVFICFLIIGYFVQPPFYWHNTYLLFLHLFFLMIIYGLDTVLLSLLIKNPVGIVIVFFLFILSNNFTIQANEFWIAIYLFVFPNGDYYFFSFFSLFLYDLWLICFLYTMIYHIYKKIDIQI